MKETREVSMMRRTIVVERPPQAPLEVPTCQHHWIIETPRGAISKGLCKRCGSEREFRNSANDYVWEDDSSHSYNNRTGIRPTPKAADYDEVATAPRSDNAARIV